MSVTCAYIMCTRVRKISSDVYVHLPHFFSHLVTTHHPVSAKPTFQQRDNSYSCCLHPDLLPSEIKILHRQSHDCLATDTCRQQMAAASRDFPRQDFVIARVGSAVSVVWVNMTECNRACECRRLEAPNRRSDVTRPSIRRSARNSVEHVLSFARWCVVSCEVITAVTESFRS